MPFPDFSPLEWTILGHIQHIKDAEAHVFVKEGEEVVDMVIHPAKGGNLPQGIINQLNSGEHLRLLHNHPTGASISVDDLTVLSNYPTLEIFAVTDSGSVHGARVLDDMQAQDLKKRVPKLGNVEAMMQGMINPTSILPVPSCDIDHIPHVVNIYRNQRLQEVGAIEFYCSLSPYDSLITVSLYKTELKRRWMTFLKQQFP